MVNIRLNNPYKVIESKHKQYIRHYRIPSADCVIIPNKTFGDQILCNVFWKGEDGMIQQKNQLMFNSANLEEVDAIRHFSLHSLWENLEKHESQPTA